MTFTAEEQRERNRATKQRYNEKKKRLAALQTGASPEVDGSEGAPVEVEVKNIQVEPHKPTLRERLGLGSKKVEPTPRVQSKRSRAPNLITTVLPTLLASIVVTYARDRIPEEYARCAPTQQEAQAVISPLMDILARRVTIAAKVSRDAIDLTNALIAAMAFGVRSYITYVDIKKEKIAKLSPQEKREMTQRDHDEATARINARYDDRGSIPSPKQRAGYESGLRAYQAQAHGADTDSSRVNGGGPGVEESGIAGNGAGDLTDDSELRRHEAAEVAKLLRRDTVGRVAKGLV